MKPIPKDHRISFRCDDEQFDRIKQKAEASNRTLADYTRLAALNARVAAQPKLTPEQAAYFKTLQTHNHNFTMLGNYIRAKNPMLDLVIKQHLEQTKKLTHLFFPEL